MYVLLLCNWIQGPMISLPSAARSQPQQREHATIWGMLTVHKRFPHRTGESFIRGSDKPLLTPRAESTDAPGTAKSPNSTELFWI